MFGFLKNKKFIRSDRKLHANSEYESDELLDSLLLNQNAEDYLGQAAQAGQASKDAVKAGEYNKAWALLHQQKSLYLQHAHRGNWKAKDVLCLDGSVSQALANILRLEGKHEQAFVHILYWIITSRNPIKAHDQKLKSYFKRCKFKNAALDDVQDFIKKSLSTPDFSVIQNKVNEWKEI